MKSAGVLMKRIEEMRQSRVICYIGGDRQNISTRIAPDIIPVFYKHLEQMGPSERIDLFLFTKGGDVLTALRLVHLLYEYTDRFSVLVPYKAYSAGTLVCLGASEIVMGKLGELSPVDPNITSMFNPADPANPQMKLAINVEDVYSYISIVKNIVGIKNDEALAGLFGRLVDQVHPLAVGTIHRTYSLIRLVAQRLLLTHMDISRRDEIDEIITTLTEKLFAHNYMISRAEARDTLKLPVIFSSPELESVMWELYETYRENLQLERPFIPEDEADMDGRFSVCCGIIDSALKTDGYFFDGVIQKTAAPGQGYQGNVSITNQGWKPIERSKR